MHTAYTTTTTKKTIATQWYTMNIDYKFLCIWISSFSLSEYIVEMYLQQYDIASGGQWRPRMYFSWYTSSFILNDGVYDVIESINCSRSSANLQHFSIKCLTVSGSLEQSGQVDSIFLLLRDVDKIFISFLLTDLWILEQEIEDLKRHSSFCHADPRWSYPWRTGAHYPVPRMFKLF